MNERTTERTIEEMEVTVKDLLDRWFRADLDQDLICMRAERDKAEIRKLRARLGGNGLEVWGLTS